MANTTTSKQQTKIFEAFNGTTYVPNAMDVQVGALWDSITMSAGQTLTRPWWDLFTYPMVFETPHGPPSDYRVRRKTIADTNMTQGRRLDAPEAFSISRVVFTFSRDTSDKDLYAVAENLMWRFWMGQKRYLWAVIVSLPTIHIPIAPLHTCDFCNGVYANSTQCPGCGASEFKLTSLGKNSEQVPGRQFYLDVEPRVVINNQMSFFADFEGPPYVLEGPFKMWCHLEGLHARGLS